MSKNVRICVYVPCYNAKETLAPVLEAILRQTRKADQVLLVDDGSTDGSADMARGYAGAGVGLVQCSRNAGLGAARNRALAACEADILVGIDADVEAEDDYLEQVQRVFDSHPKTGAFCGRLIEAWTASAADRWRAVHMSQDPGPHPSNQPRFLNGCTTSIRRDVAVRIGGWNERFTAAHEDVDLTQRLRAAGIPLRYEPACRARHLKRDTVAGVLTGFWKWFFPAGDLAGHFDNPALWPYRRIRQVQWGIFRHRFDQDLAHDRGDLLPLTLLLPWWMTLRDVIELRRRHPGFAGELTAVALALPRAMNHCLDMKGAPRQLVDWMASWIAELEPFLAVDATQRPTRGAPWVAEALQIMTFAAETFFPSDPAIWHRVADALR